MGYKRGYVSAEDLPVDKKDGISLSWKNLAADNKLGQSDAWDPYKHGNGSAEDLPVDNKLDQAEASDLESVETLKASDPNYEPASEKVPDAAMLIGMAVETPN